ncbi:MAG TPA: transposase [Chitinophagales bacterium]|nr:transposase [Chitinophagales bacterium]
MHFFSATINSWQPLLQNDNLKLIMIDSFDWLVKNKRVNIHAFVIMPNHIHLLWTRAETYEINEINNDMLSFTGHAFKKYLLVHNPEILKNYISTQGDRDYHFWERRPRTIEVMRRDIAIQKLEYIHNNPIKEKWGLANFPEEYFFSSAAYYFNDSKQFTFLSHVFDFID